MDRVMKLPVGIDNFCKIRQDGYYYTDKTRLIEQLFADLGEVNLFTRPRRFGKTLNMSMLKAFLRSEQIRRCSTGCTLRETGRCVKRTWEGIPSSPLH